MNKNIVSLFDFSGNWSEPYWKNGYFVWQIDIKLGINILTGSIPSGSVQNWRVIRRVEKDNFVLIRDIPSYRDAGLLIPENFNPNYDPYSLARKAGLI